MTDFGLTLASWYNPISWVSFDLSGYITGFIAWLLNPTALLGWGQNLLAWICSSLAQLIGDPIGASLTSVGTFLQGNYIAYILKLGAFFAQPFVAPTLFMAAIGAKLWIWVIVCTIKLAMLIKGHVWSAAS